MFLKICGITRLDDARHAADHGATAVGYIFWPNSPRYVHPQDAAKISAMLPEEVAKVGVFVNESIEQIRKVAECARLTMIQLHGEESPAYASALDWPVLRSATLDSAPKVWTDWSTADATFLLDASDPIRRGGTGVTVDWDRAAALARTRRLVLAGGLTPANVASAIAHVRPFGVDVSSGVEQSLGVKDTRKISEFLDNARRAFARVEQDSGNDI